jgi:2-iminobutanoate/2-iminopropanoate deaminase
MESSVSRNALSLMTGLFFAAISLQKLASLMPKKEIRDPEKEKTTGAYSAAVEVDGWVYVSGQGPLNPKTAEVIRGSIEDETRTTLLAIERILKAAGCGMSDVVKSTVHLADMEEFDRYNAVYKEFFQSRGATILPARTTVQSKLWNEIKVEIDVIARKSS